MRLVEQLSKDNVNEDERKKKRKRDFYMEEEETLSYMDYKPAGYINEGKGVYKGFGEVGINNAKSIYDRQAVFNTREQG